MLHNIVTALVLLFTAIPFAIGIVAALLYLSVTNGFEVGIEWADSLVAFIREETTDVDEKD